MSTLSALTVPAPAKVNLFLHVVGRRKDGYHLLESLFTLVDLADTLVLTLRDDGAVVRGADIAGVADDDDLSLRAARALRAAADVREGVTVRLTKRIPQGAGLGGGSSDAASVLLALNRLWRLDWPRARLADLGLTLGADVPFFVGGANALARGVGERLTPVTLPGSWMALAFPRAKVRTAEIFAAPELTRSTPSAKMDVFSDSYGRNDLAQETATRFPAVAEAIDAMARVVPQVRMTGSGACVFAACATQTQAQRALASLPPHIEGHLARTLARHPLADFAR
ncbi:MAG: 4-(cytidine 5'-diphospho)-2-C-methyl-D-erythritol kinase [Burkholderiales bacterium]|nr:4-(cytidine 5'-diphospho)-2-C-methyl-D-erythritol kinase [Burkholderiales bacterium]